MCKRSNKTVNRVGYHIPKSGLEPYFGYLIGDYVLRESRYLLKILLPACRKAFTKRCCKAEPPTQKTNHEIYDIEQLTDESSRGTVSREMGKKVSVYKLVT